MKDSKFNQKSFLTYHYAGNSLSHLLLPFRYFQTKLFFVFLEFPQENKTFWAVTKPNLILEYHIYSIRS